MRLWFLFICFARPALALPYQATLEAGFQTFQFDYQERLTLPAKSSESALLPGFLIGLDYSDPLEPWFFSVGGSASLGKSVYDGSLQDLTPFSATTSNRMLTGSFRIGSKANVFWNSELRLFIGVGYENWERDVAQDTPHRVKETYSWFSVPIGFRWAFPLGAGVSVAPEASAFVVLGAQVRIHHNEVDPRLSDGTLKPSEAWGMDLRLPIQWEISSGGFQWGLVPWFRLSRLGESPAVALRTANGSIIVDAVGRTPSSYEPASTTVSYGTALMVRQAF